VGDQEASRPAVLGVERLASELVRDPSAAIRDVFKREVCRVAAVAPRPPVAKRQVPARRPRNTQGARWNATSGPITLADANSRQRTPHSPCNRRDRAAGARHAPGLPERESTRRCRRRFGRAASAPLTCWLKTAGASARADRLRHAAAGGPRPPRAGRCQPHRAPRGPAPPRFARTTCAPHSGRDPSTARRER
jgi:hypothetical protein